MVYFGKTRHDVSGLKDESGMRFYLTENLRQFDAGIMELGLVYTDRMAIPPQQNKFPLSGHCLPECTAVVRLFDKPKPW